MQLSTMSFFLVLLLFFFFSAIKNTEAFRVNNNTSLSFELIHLHSKYAPLYDGNLTKGQRHRKLHDLSYSGNQKFQARLTLPDSVNNIGYAVQISIGTPAITHQLLLDTGSDVTWIQCQPSEASLYQKEPIFDPEGSSTFEPVLSSDHLCSRPNFYNSNGKCAYSRIYEDYSSTKGNLSRDIIKVDDNGMPFRFAFGCSVRSKGSFGKGISGILGMDTNPVSFPSQLRSRSFSYCFPKNVNLVSLLRFDTEIHIPGLRGRKMHSTPFVKSKNRLESYNVELTDITIFGRRLGLASNTFASHPEGDHFLIDSGTSFTFLIPPIYKLVKELVLNYLAQHNVVLAPEARSVMRFDLCYHFNPSIVFGWPNMVLHLKGGSDLVIESSQLFFMEPDLPFFCLAFGKSSRNVLGNYQQRNVRFVFDLVNNMLHFGQEDCNADSSN